MARELPVVFLAFANELDDHLAMLKAESRDVYRALQPLQDNDRIAVHREESSELDELYADLLRHDERVVIFHYGGHANGRMLQLEGGGAGARGLAALLGQQTGLKLVFLNGCATQGHVNLLLQAGVPAVIATSVPIGDKKAQEFSVAFYMALAEGQSIAEAFASGSALVEASHGARGDSGISFSRNSEWEDDDDVEDSPLLEWGLYTRKDSADVVEQWRLPDARTEWNIQLEDKNGPLRGLDGNAQVIEHRSRIRTVDTISCSNCGSTVAVRGHAVRCCKICGSDQVETDSARTAIADQRLRFAVSEDAARQSVLQLAGDTAEITQLNRLFLPYWVLEVQRSTAFDVERGVNRDFTAATPALEWEPVKGKIDLSIDSYLVPAGSAPVRRDSATHNWYWELDQAEPLGSLDIDTASVPLDRSLQAAFDQASTDLDQRLEDEIADRVGAYEQRNLSTDTRYRSVGARTILLPHWCATVRLEKAQAEVLVNGQTGAAQALSLPGSIPLNNRSTSPMSERTYEPGTQAAKSYLAASVFAAVGIGLMVGTLLGLANPPLGDGKPIVAIFIGAVGAVLAALLGLNDRHFSTAKALRIGSFGLAVVISAPLGIMVRDHQLLAPDPPAKPSLADRKKELLSLGVDEEDARKVMAAAIVERIRTDAKASDSAVAYSPGGLHSTPTSKTTCDYLKDQIKEWKDPGIDASDIISSISGFLGDADEKAKWMPLLDAVTVPNETSNDDRTKLLPDNKKLLLIAVDAGCGDAISKAISPSDEQCTASSGSNGLKGSSLVSALDTDDAKRIRDRIASDLSPSLQKRSQALLGEFLCR